MFEIQFLSRESTHRTFHFPTTCKQELILCICVQAVLPQVIQDTEKTNDSASNPKVQLL